MSEISRLSILKDHQEMLWHNVLCYSANYLMDKAKPGQEPKWSEALEKAKIIDQMVKELTDEAGKKEDVCPKCGHDTLKFSNGRIEDDFYVYDWNCPACNADGEEEYKLTFHRIYSSDSDENSDE